MKAANLIDKIVQEQQYKTAGLKFRELGFTPMSPEEAAELGFTDKAVSVLRKDGTRVVYDFQHTSLAVISADGRVVSDTYCEQEEAAERAEGFLRTTNDKPAAEKPAKPDQSNESLCKFKLMVDAIDSTEDVEMTLKELCDWIDAEVK